MLPYYPKEKLGIKIVPVPAAQYRDDVSLWIPYCKMVLKGVSHLKEESAIGGKGTVGIWHETPLVYKYKKR